MNTRISQFIAAEGLSQAEFAKILEVAPASVSHVTSGRNNPGSEFLQSLTRHFPTLSIEWILTGSGKMYRDQQQSEPISPATVNLEPESAPVLQEATLFQPEPLPVYDTPLPATASKTISKVIVFWSDGSFTELDSQADK